MESKNEQLKPEEIIVPQETAIALGRGLNQFFEPLQEIEQYINKLKNNQTVNKAYLQQMGKAIKQILSIPTKLEKAKETRIVPFMGGLDFAFSTEERTPEEQQQPLQSEIILDDATIPPLQKLTGAMQHNFNNNFIPLMGYPSMIEASAQDSTTRQQAGELVLKTQSIYSELNKIQTADYQLKISTDSEGKTTLSPIQRPPDQSNDIIIR